MFLKGLFGGGKAKKQILAPAEGKCVPMSEVNDPTFSQEILGKGIAIIPAVGKVYAPADGEVTMVFETKHALSVKTSDGAELIIHIGLDTVNLQGKYFNAPVHALWEAREETNLEPTPASFRWAGERKNAETATRCVCLTPQ